jgi:hypothetical protein
MNSIDYSKLTNKHFLVKEISALKGIGLEDSIRWLYNTMRDYSQLEEQKFEIKKPTAISYVDLV